MLEKLKKVFVRTKVIAILLSGVLSSIAFCTYRLIQDPDFFWHVKAGEWIIKNGKIPQIDVFSWYGAGKNLLWVTHEWLAEVLLYLGARNLGFIGLEAIFAVLLFILLWLCLEYADLRIKKLNPHLTDKTRGFVLLVALPMFYLLIMPFFAIRPQIFSFILFVVCAILYEKGYDWWSIPVILLAVNFHGGIWPIYFALAAYYLLPRRKIGLLLLIFLLPLATVNLQWTFLYPIYGLLDKSIGIYITEWQAAKLFSFSGSMWLSLALVLMILLPKKKMGMWNLLAIFLISIQAIRSTRFELLFPIFLVPLFLAYLDYDKISLRCGHLLNRIVNSTILQRYQSWKNSITESEEQPSDGKLVWNDSFTTVANSLIGIVLLVTILTISWNGTSISDEELVSNKDFPVAAVEYIKAHPDLSENLLNHYNFGGYLIYNDIPPFIDGRADPFVESFNPGKAIFAQYFSIFTGLKSSPLAAMNEYGIKNILWIKGTPLYTYIKDEPAHFNVVYEDEEYFIAVVKR